jgi:predicted dehydrogenase
MGQFHLKNLLEIKKIKKIYAFDISEKTFKIKDSKINYSTKIKSFDDKNVDFVDIVAPTQFHFDYLKKYIKQNKNIFIEKPIVSNIDEMKKIEKTIEKENYT